jgi:pimeloyl-ACP methyl ester carboxylesterase
MDDGRNHTMAQHVEDVAAFIRALNVGKVHLVGNSYGGNVVARVALKYPELLRSVVLGEPGGLIAPVSAEGKAAVAAAQKETEKFRQAIEAGDLRQAAILLYDGVLAPVATFRRLPARRIGICSPTRIIVRNRIAAALHDTTVSVTQDIA